MSLTGDTDPEISSKIGIRPIAATTDTADDIADIVSELIYPFLVDPLRKLKIKDMMTTLNVGNTIRAAELFEVLFLPEIEAQTTIPAREVMNISVSNE